MEFSVSPLDAPKSTRKIVVLRSFSATNFSFLREDYNEKNDALSFTCHLDKDVEKKLSDGITLRAGVYVKIIAKDDSFQFGFMTQTPAGVWFVSVLDHRVTMADLDSTPDEPITFEKTLEKALESSRIESVYEKQENKSLVETFPDKPSKRPNDFLAERYFSTLYLVTAPLNFFAKSAISRVRAMCHGDMALLSKSVSDVLIGDINRFDSRHTTFSSKRGLIDGDTLNEHEAEFRQTFVSEKIPNADSIRLLKSREAQLQIVIALEMLSILPEGLEPSPLIRRPKKNRLVGRKKRLVPTFIGMVVSSHVEEEEVEESPASGKSVTRDSLTEYVNSLVDRLCIWESLEGESAVPFVRDTLIPFFQKQHPDLIKSVCRKVKGPSFSQKLYEMHKKKKQRQAELKQKRANNGKDLPMLTGTVDEPDAKVKGLATASFEKRTFDMVSRTSFSQMSMSLQKESEQHRVTKQEEISKGIFHGPKRKLGVSSIAKPVTQISETPTKKRIVNVVDAAPVDSSPVASRTPRVESSSPIITREVSLMNGSPVAKRRRGGGDDP